MSGYWSSEDTICAVTTPPGSGGVAVLRVSGPKALEITRRCCPFLPGSPESHRIYYGFFRSLDVADTPSKKIDEVLASYFAVGKSFTGEETLEISCHGGRFLTSIILKELLFAGARLAKPGEFTRRAYLNQRVDLVQAEAVLELIKSENASAAQLALRQLEGGFSSVFQSLKERLTRILAHLEANIDFASEDIEIASAQDLLKSLEGIIEESQSLLHKYQLGRQVREGLSVLLMGEPNAGKSSVLNVLLKDEKAIVTEVPGTTRDLIEGSIELKGLPFKFIDSAGLRETHDMVERLGIEKTRQQAGKVDFIGVIVDGSQNSFEALNFARQTIQADKIFLIVNKSDLVTNFDAFTRSCVAEVGEDFWRSLQQGRRLFFVSALNRSGFEPLLERWEEEVAEVSENRSGGLINARHFEGLREALTSMDAARNSLLDDHSPELIAQDLHFALKSFYEILGETFDDQVMDRVFREFCLGK